MSNIKVEYVDHQGSDLFVANVARVSFNKWKGEYDEKDGRLIDYLAAHEHTSPFRHTCISLRCKVPLFLARQLGKHQIGLSWNEASRRYVDTDIEFFVPDSWHVRPTGGMKQGCGEEEITHIKHVLSPVSGATISEPIENTYKGATSVCLEIYNTMLKNGVAPEEARMVLPQSMMVDFIWTGSLQAFYHVYRLRSDGHAQTVAREFAAKLEEIVQPLFPKCWEALKNAEAN